MREQVNTATASLPFSDLPGQEVAARFLSAVLKSNTPAHAYLFAGPLGSGKTETAQLFMRALLCENSGRDNSGRDTCDSCRRVSHGTHPDVHTITPQGAAGYLAEQIQEVIASALKVPVRAKRKVFLFTRADLLGGHAANALLKTLEEPPDDTLFILLARNRDMVLETIVSRCQVLPFRRIPEDEAIAAIVQKTGATPENARIALSATGGSLFYAERFWRSQKRRNLRVLTLETLERLRYADDASVLESAKELARIDRKKIEKSIASEKQEHKKEVSKERGSREKPEADTEEEGESALNPLEKVLKDVLKEQQRTLEQSRDFLSPSALKRLDQQFRREFTGKERETIGEILDVSRSWLRDIMLVQMPQSQEKPTNSDFIATIERAAKRMSLMGCVRALGAVDEAQRQIQYNVSLQLALEVMLFSLREEL